MWYRLARVVVRLFFRIVYRWRVYGVEHVPATGPVLLCSNHISLLDPPLVAAPLNRRVSFMAKEQLFRIPVLNRLFRLFGAFPVRRGAVDRRSLRMALDVLERGGLLVIFPEGTRSRTGELLPGKPGAGLLALQARATVIPVYIHGPFRLFRPVYVYYGPPVDLQPFWRAEPTVAEARKATEAIMAAIRRLAEAHGQDAGRKGGVPQAPAEGTANDVRPSAWDMRK